MQLNRHFITLFVFLGCCLRVYYIYMTDLTESLQFHIPRKYHAFFEYGLRGVNEVFWFISFAYLAFFWYELQFRGMKRGVINVNDMKPAMIKCILGFVFLRGTRVAAEILNFKVGVLTGKVRERRAGGAKQ